MELLRLKILADRIKKLSRRWKLILGGGIIVIFLTVIFSWIASSKIHDLEDVIDSGRLVVVTDSSSIGFAVNKDSVYGFQYEIIKAFADSLGVELEISEQNDVQRSIEDLKNGEYDIVANLIPMTSDLKKGVLFSKTILSSRQVLVQRLAADSLQPTPVRKQYELANDTIYIPYNSVYKMRIENLADEIADSIHILEVKNVSVETMVRMVSLGRIKNTICSAQLAEKLKRQYPNIDISLPIGFTQEHGWALNMNSPELTAKLNDFLSDFVGSSAYWELYRKYY
mgnify:CR=1 FL=1